jgi:hypothetical protein
VVTLSGAVSGCIGQTEGTIYAEVDLSNLTTGKAIMQIDDGTTTNRIACFVNTNPNRFEALVAGGGVSTVLSGSITTGTHKASFSYSSGNIQVYLDGVFLTSGTPTNFPTVALTNISIGSRISAGVYGAHLTDRLRAAALYTTRLTNAELAALTTL